MSKLHFNYRKFYEEQTGKKIPKDFDVHHIDFNRNNNDIINLVAIPKKLHKKYHAIIAQIFPIGSFTYDKSSFTPFLSNDYYIGELGYVKYEIENIAKNINIMQETLHEVSIWCNYKNLLLKTLTQWRVDEFLTIYKNFQY
jgi:hypothetical protein